MTAVFRRELGAYFLNPLGYVFLAAFYVFGGYFFFEFNLVAGATDMRGTFNAMFLVTVFLVPALTMRLFAEDRKMKTDQLLFMAPLSMAAIVTGKLLAACAVFLLGISVMPLTAVVMSLYALPEWPVVIGHFIGLFLLGTALISVGMFISCLTENQIIAAIGGFCAGLLMIVVESLSNVVKNDVLSALLKGLSVQNHYRVFTLGLIGLKDVTFFVSLNALFAFLTVLALQKRRFM